MQQTKRATVVLDVHPLLRGSEKAVVEAKLGRRPGVERVEANPVSQTATVTYDPAKTSLADLRRWVQECGLHCAGQSVPEHICDPLLEPEPPDGHGHQHAATVDIQAPPAQPDHDHRDLAVGSAAGHAGHTAPAEKAMRSPHDVMGHGGHGAMSMAAMAADLRNRFLVAALFSIPILLWSPIGRDVLGFEVAAPFGLRDDIWSLLLSLPVILYSCWIFFNGAVRALRARTLLDLAPPRALLIRDGEPVEVPTAEVQVGDLLLVRPDTKLATDGVVEDGQSEVDESVVTGESLPVHKQPGDQVIGATINTNSTLRVRATKVGSDTALAQIVKLVQEAQNSKAPGQRLADQAAFWLVLVALVGGGLTLVAWLLAGRPFSQAILFAITLVVVTCPDALGLATPMAIMIGTGLGAKRGILFKHAVALETAARIDTVVLDKTGTLTKGQPEVTEIVRADGVTEAELLRLVAAVERESEHPLAEAIVHRADQAGIEPVAADWFENLPGQGAAASVQGRRVVVGNCRLMEREQVDLGPLAARREQLASRGRTVVVAAADHRPLGLFAIADAPRETSEAAIRALHDAKVQVIMLTGDNRATAEGIADQLGIDQVIAEVLPGDKATKVTELQRSGRKVAMVGDGVNDAPALAQADLGIAIGAGTDVAIETADVVLMRSDPLDVPTALRIGRGTLRKERQNLSWAIAYNAVAMPIAAGVFEPAFGLVLRPEIAALSMSGSSLIVAVNALTLKRLRLPRRYHRPSHRLGPGGPCQRPKRPHDPPGHGPLQQSQRGIHNRGGSHVAPCAV